MCDVCRVRVSYTDRYSYVYINNSGEGGEEPRFGDVAFARYFHVRTPEIQSAPQLKTAPDRMQFFCTRERRDDNDRFCGAASRSDVRWRVDRSININGFFVFRSFVLVSFWHSSVRDRSSSRFRELQRTPSPSVRFPVSSRATSRAVCFFLHSIRRQCLESTS